MFTAIYNFFIPMTPLRRAKREIADLERDLYEARHARIIAKQTLQAKELRCEQLADQIDEMQRTYCADDSEAKTVFSVGGYAEGGSISANEVQKILTREINRGVRFVGRKP